MATALAIQLQSDCNFNYNTEHEAIEHTTSLGDPGKHCLEHQCRLSAASSATLPAPSSPISQSAPQLCQGAYLGLTVCSKRSLLVQKEKEKIEN